MGLLSKLKKGVKKIGSAVTKAVKAVVKPIRKALDNKIVRGLLLATTFFTGAGAIMGAFQAGGFKAAAAGAALKHVANVGVKMIRAPLDLISAGIKGVGSLASGMGATGTGQWLQGVSSGLTSRVDSIANAATNVFGGATTAAPTGAAAAAPAVTAPVGVPVGAGAEQFANQYVQSLGAAPQAPAAQPGLLKRAMTWAEQNPELTKLAVDTVAGMTAPEPYTQTTLMQDRDRMWAKENAQNPAGVSLSGNPFASGTGMSLLQQLRERNQQFLTPTPAGG
jgi:hypothetical protein